MPVVPQAQTYDPQYPCPFGSFFIHNKYLYMIFAVIALATSTVPPALCASTQYGYGNLFVEFTRQ
jgi:hypothetical protein